MNNPSFFSRLKFLNLLLFLTVTVFFSCTSTNNNADKEHIGKNLFEQNCSLCHGNDGKLMAAGAPDLSVSVIDKDAALIAIEKGSPQKGMPAYANRFSKEDLLAIRDYIFELRKTK
jgi:mono/diheme cytochrome c family protein